MKISSLAIVILSALSMNAMADTPPSTINGGTIHFKGEVINAACDVSPGSADQTIQLGQVRTSKLAAPGATGVEKGINFELNECDTSVYSKVAIAFAGETVENTNSAVLALQKSEEGTATNVGIQILDMQGNPLSLSGDKFSDAFDLSTGDNTLAFQARYYATGAATPGSANADATFKVQYQ